MDAEDNNGMEDLVVDLIPMEHYDPQEVFTVLSYVFVFLNYHKIIEQTESIIVMVDQQSFWTIDSRWITWSILSEWRGN